MKNSNLRRFSGVLLILLAVAGLVLWEARGRALVLMADVCAAAEDIAEGERLEASMFRVVSVPRDALVEGAVAARDLDAAVEGLLAAVPIRAGAMLSDAYIEAADADLHRDESYFVLDRSWISMRSSALRRGDQAEVFTADGARSFGVFDIGFVKGADEEEVREAAGVAGLVGDAEPRVDATSPIDHVEIVTKLPTYLAIKAYAEAAPGPSLILVGKDIVP
jgi:hypothetical protein